MDLEKMAEEIVVETDRQRLQRSYLSIDLVYRIKIALHRVRAETLEECASILDSAAKHNYSNSNDLTNACNFIAKAILQIKDSKP